MRHVRPLVLFAVVALFAAACGGVNGDPASTTTTAPGRTATTAESSTTTTVPGETSLENDAIQEQIDELIVEAQQIRNLEFLEPVEVVLLSNDAYQARIKELIAEELTQDEIDAENALFRMLGIIGPEESMKDVFDTLFSTGTGGFYDPETGELVVRVVGDELGPQAKSVVIHELVHALQDQHFDLLDESDDLEGDAAYVATVIIEGDALLREVTYVESLSLSEQAEYFADFADIDLTALDDLPQYVVNSLQEPYLDGFFFHQRAGLDRVDDLFTDLPESSEQILDGDKYAADEQPIEVTLPELDLDGYEVYTSGVLGQKDIQLLLTEAVGTGEAEEAAAGWGGDAFRVYTRGDSDAVFVLSYVGDSRRDAEELADGFERYWAEMAPDGVFNSVSQDGATVSVIAGTDVSLRSDLEATFG